MKTYGVNWFLVWIGFLFQVLPVCAWLRELIYFQSDHSIHSHSASWISVSMQALFMSLVWTYIRYSSYSQSLADLKAVEQRRQSQQRSQTFWKRYNWPVTWATVFAIVAAISGVCKAIFGWPSWLHVVGYSLLLPCSFLGSSWLIIKAGEKGQLAQLLKGGEEAP